MIEPLFRLPRHDAAVEVPTQPPDPRIAKAHRAIGEAFGRFEQGRDYPYASGGDWSTTELVAYMLEQTGPAELIAATWSVAEHAAVKLNAMIEDGRLTAVEMLVDWRVQVRTPSFLAVARQKFSDIRVSSCHAKAFVVRNDEWALSCVGSANFTNNPRIEAGHISTSREVAHFHTEWIRAEIQNAAPFGVDMRKAGKRDGRK